MNNFSSSSCHEIIDNSIKYACKLRQFGEGREENDAYMLQHLLLAWRGDGNFGLQIN
jgi:hypothetical protein